MRLNAAALALIKEFEGFVNHAYPDPATGGEPLTIGYGHTSQAGPPKVTKGMTVTKAEAEAILEADLKTFASAVTLLVTVSLTDNQFGALVSLAYNVGVPNFKRSTLLKKLNAGDYAGSADEFARWNRAAGKVMAGLTRRRAAERALFLSVADVPGDHEQPPTAPARGWLAALLAFLLSLLKGFRK